MFKPGDEVENKITGSRYGVREVLDNGKFLVWGYTMELEQDKFKLIQRKQDTPINNLDNPFITHVPAHTKIDKAPVIPFFDRSLFFCDPKSKYITLRGPHRGQQVHVGDLREFAKKINQLADALEMVG